MPFCFSNVVTLSKCGSRSKMESGVKKSTSHARVQRKAREDGGTESSSSSTSSSSEDEDDTR